MYHSEWQDVNGIRHRVEFLKESFFGPSKELLFASFEMNYPEVDLFGEDILLGCGLNMTIVTPTPLKYLHDFYVVDPLGIQVVHYICKPQTIPDAPFNMSMVDLVNFVGYLNTEQFEDPISNGENYEITISANNGIALFDRLRVDLDLEDLTKDGALIQSMQVIKHCFDKLNINYTSIKTNLSTHVAPYPWVSSPLTSPISTTPYNGQILHKLFVLRENFYDEKDIASTCREAVNDILLPMYCKVYIYNNCIYILDLEELNKTSNPQVRTINYTTGAIGSVESIQNSELFTIHTALQDVNVGMTPGKNRVSVRFNKFAQANPKTIPLNINTVSELEEVNEFKKGEDVLHRELIYKKAKGFEILPQTHAQAGNVTHNQFVQKVGGGGNSTSDGEFYIRLLPVSDYAGYRLQINTGIFVTSSNQFVGLDMQLMFEDYSRYGEEHVIDRHTIGQPFLFSAGIQSSKEGYSYHPHNANLKSLFSTTHWRNDFMSQQKPYPWNWDGVIPWPDGISYYSPLYVHINDYESKIQFNKWYSLNGDVQNKNLWSKGGGYDKNSNSVVLPLNNPVMQTGSTQTGGYLYFHIYVPPLGKWKPAWYLPYENYHNFKGFLLKDITVHLLETQDKDPVTGYNYYDRVDNTDVEFEGTADSNYISELLIETKQGTDYSNFSKGAFFIKINTSYEDCPNQTQNNPPYRYVRAARCVRGRNVGGLEKLLLNCYLSSLKESRFKFTVEVEGYHPPFRNFETSLLQRNGVNVKLIPTAMSVDYATARTRFTMEEYNKEDLIIEMA